MTVTFPFLSKKISSVFRHIQVQRRLYCGCTGPVCSSWAYSAMPPSTSQALFGVLWSHRRLVLVHTLTSEVLRPHQAPVHTGLLPRASSMSSWVKWRHWHFHPFLFKYNKMLNEQIHIRKYETATERRSRAETTDESQEDLRRINYLRNQGGE